MNDTDVPVVNVSADATPDHGKSRPTRTLSRDPLGRFARPLAHANVRVEGTDGATLNMAYGRRPEQVGPLGPAGGIGPGGVDAVTGRWLEGAHRNDVLFRDPLNWERVTHVPADFSAYPPISTQQGDGGYPYHLRTRRV